MILDRDINVNVEIYMPISRQHWNHGWLIFIILFEGFVFTMGMFTLSTFPDICDANKY